MPDFKLKYQIVADAAKAKAEVRDFDDVLKGVGGRIGGLGTGAAVFTAGIAAAGAAAVGAGVALFNLTKTAADYGSTIFDASKKTGLHAESLSAMDFAAKQSGTSLEAITGGIAKFSKAVGAAADDTKKATKFMQDFGFTPQEALNDLDGALGKVFKKIMDTPAGVQRMTLAQKAFGRSGADLLPFLDSFDGDLGKLIKKAKELGVTIDDDAAKAADEFGDQLDTLSAQLAGAGRAIAGPFMGPFTDMAKGVSAWLVQNKDEISRWGQQLADTLGGLIGYWNDYHKAAAGEGSRYAVNKAGEKLYPTDFLFSGALGLALSQRGTQGRMDRAPAYGASMGGYALDPRTNTLIPYTPPTAPSATAPTGTGGGKKRPPKETDSEFRRFFEERGFGVSRTFGGAINTGSLHPSGMAADVRIGGKSVAEIFALTAAALDKGYRLFDERVKRPGVKQTGPHLHFERGGSLKESSFLGAGMYGGSDQLAYLKSLDAARMGKASGQSAFQAFTRGKIEDEADLQRLMEETLQSMSADIISAEEKASEDRLAIRQKEADHAVNIIEGMVLRNELTEQEAVERLGQLKLDMLLEEKRELDEQIPTKKNIQRLEELSVEISDQKLQNENELLRINKQLTEEYQKQTRALEKRNQRPGLKKRQLPGEGDGLLDQLYTATGGIQSMDDVLHQLGQTATDVFMQMGAGLAASVEAWIMLGDQADISAKKMIASLLAGVARQALTLAIFHTAMGVAALTPWGAAMYGPAALHFKAAAIWGAVGIGAALAGRAVAGGGGGSSRSSGAVSDQRSAGPYSRETRDVYASGSSRDQHGAAIASAIEKLEKKISSMRAGDVLVAGAKQKRGFVGNQAAEDVKSNAAVGNKLARSMGMR